MTAIKCSATDTAWFALRERARWSPRRRCWSGRLGRCRQAAVQLSALNGLPRARWHWSPQRAAAALTAGADFVIDCAGEFARQPARAEFTRDGRARRRTSSRPARAAAVFEAALRRSLARPPRGDRLAGRHDFRLCGPTIFCSRTSRSVGADPRLRQTPPGPGGGGLARSSNYTATRIKPAAATVFPLERAGEALARLRDRNIDGRAVLPPARRLTPVVVTRGGSTNPPGLPGRRAEGKHSLLSWTAMACRACVDFQTPPRFKHRFGWREKDLTRHRATARAAQRGEARAIAAGGRRSNASSARNSSEWTALIEEVRFTRDSPLEEAGFEPSVPVKGAVIFFRLSA